MNTLKDSCYPVLCRFEKHAKKGSFNSQIYYIKVQKQKFWTKLENQKKSSERKKKIYPKTINKSLSKFWNHSKTWDLFQNISPAKVFPDTWILFRKTCLKRFAQLLKYFVKIGFSEFFFHQELQNV